MDILKQLLGRLHPLIVHLPIGFIVLGLLLQWSDRKRRLYTPLIAMIFLWAGLSAIAACVTGYLQYLVEGYAFDTVKWHLWMGIATAIFAFVMYSRLKEISGGRYLTRLPVAAFSLLLLLLISVTGHLGGTITHGEDYLVEPLPNSIKAALGFETYEQRPIVLPEENWQEALIYEDVIATILTNNCVSCHNPKKNKGDLLLNSKEGILKGGENGEVLLAYKAGESELFRRMKLPESDEDHMPPEEKNQPGREEVQLIGAWIDAGHPFTGTIGEAGLHKELFRSFFPKKWDKDYPESPVSQAVSDSIRVVKEAGIHVENISKATHFLSVSCINKPAFNNNDFELLRPLAPQIAILDLGGTQVTDAIFEKLAGLPNLTVLKVHNNTQITGRGIQQLSELQNLRSINLSGTKFNETFLESFEPFSNLEHVYLYDTGLGQKGEMALKEGQLRLEFGNYELPPLPSDTLVY